MQSSLEDLGRRWTLPVAVLAVTLLALVLRAPGLDPPSLYLDDVWVGALTRIESIGKMAALHAHHALGFLLLEWLARRAFHDPEWSLQILPFVASLLLIPLSARLVFKLTRNTGSAFLAAALVAISPVLSAYSVRAKPFAFDALATCVLLLAAAGCLEKPSLRRLAGLGSLAVLATLLSLPALLTSAVLLPLTFGWWFLSAREPHLVRRAVLLGALVGSSLGLI
jgi:Dolichyl-phosphate-mannose-protein mannosyltransferase